MMQNPFQGMSKEQVLKALEEREWHDVTSEIEREEYIFQIEPNDEILHSFTDESIQTLANILMKTGKTREGEKIRMVLHRPGKAVCSWHQNGQTLAMLYIEPSGKVQGVLWSENGQDHEQSNPSSEEAAASVQRGRSIA